MPNFLHFILTLLGNALKVGLWAIQAGGERTNRLILLICEDIIELNLRPYNIGLFVAVSEGHPSSPSLYQTLHQHAIVPSSNENLDLFVVGFRSLVLDVVRQSDLPDEVPVVVTIEWGREGFELHLESAVLAGVEAPFEDGSFD